MPAQSRHFLLHMSPERFELPFLVRSQALYPTELRAQRGANISTTISQIAIPDVAHPTGRGPHEPNSLSKSTICVNLEATPLIPRWPTVSPNRQGVPASCAAALRRLVEPWGSNPAPLLANEIQKGPEVPFEFHIGGEGGIRTLEGLLTLTPLAGARLRPLGHLSGLALSGLRGARDDTRLGESR